MTAKSSSAPGKAILFGEHAVVYRRPAIAVPVSGVTARAVVMPAPGAPAGQIRILAPDIQLDSTLDRLPPDDPMACALMGVHSRLGISHSPACTIKIASTIPVASGLGSGAAVAVALIRAYAEFLGVALPPETVSELAYAVEKLHHGSPSGIDNTVIAYAQPIYFVREEPVRFLSVAHPIHLLIADTGIRSLTAGVVAAVRSLFNAQPERTTKIFDRIADLAGNARDCIEQGNLAPLGAMLDENHSLLQDLQVSCPELDHLVQAARSAGASGAKLSGAGRGGNMIALVDESTQEPVRAALLAAGARNVILSIIQPAAGRI